MFSLKEFTKIDNENVVYLHIEIDFTCLVRYYEICRLQYRLGTHSVGGNQDAER